MAGCGKLCRDGARNLSHCWDVWPGKGTICCEIGRFAQ